MAVGLNAAQARAKASQDMIVFEETQAIMAEVIAESAAGNFEAYVEDNTTMTTSTPTTVKIGTAVNPTVNVGDTFIFNGSTVTLGTTATNLNGVICDINDANITGLTASKDNGMLVLNIEVLATNTFSYDIGAGTANSALGLTAGTYTLTDPASVDYFSVWQGTLTDRGIANQMEQCIKYFANLGYKIERLNNTATGKTFRWHIYW